MATPSSARRTTRSQARSQALTPLPPVHRSGSAVVSNKKNRRVLADVTNETSPISGLAPGMCKDSPASKGSSPGDMLKEGEDLLRCQVKSLLQKIEQEDDKEAPPLRCQLNRFSPSAALLGPTPVNTPADAWNVGQQKSRLSVQTQTQIDTAVVEVETPIVEGTDEAECEVKTMRCLEFEVDDDEASSVAVNLSSDDDEMKIHRPSDQNLWGLRQAANENDEEEEEEDEEEVDDDYDEDGSGGYYGGEEDGEDEEQIEDELCKGVSGITMENKLPEFKGKHIRYKYNSDDEIEEEEEEKKCSISINSSSSSATKLKGVPTPKGKHHRF